MGPATNPAKDPATTFEEDPMHVDDDWQVDMAEPHVGDFVEFTEHLGDGYEGLRFCIDNIRSYIPGEGWGVEVTSTNHDPDEGPRRFTISLHEQQIRGSEYWRYAP